MQYKCTLFCSIFIVFVKVTFIAICNELQFIFSQRFEHFAKWTWTSAF